jgi:plastocyanin
MRKVTSFAAIAAAMAAVGWGTGAAAAPSSENGTRAAEAAAPLGVTVRMTEFRFRLTRMTVPKGRRVKFTVVNLGRIVHDFDIQGIKNMPIIGAKKRFTYTVSFRRGGRYRFICTVPKHSGYGMSGFLRVT